jgi:hypothetical protein
MELSLAIRTGYFSALDGNITYDGNPVKVYDTFALPEDAGYPYILLSSQTSQEQACQIYNATILIDIVTGDTRLIGRKPAEEIAAQIESLVQNINITANGWAIGDTKRESDTDLGNKNEQYYIFRKLMTYRHLINKL